jgi:periplasmic iron binding protein
LSKTWAGPIVTGLIVIGVVAILAFNFQPARDSKPTPPPPPRPPITNGPNLPEHPIGDPVFKNHIQVNAVWLAGVTMEGMSMPADVIHLEADIKSTEDNPNGFAKDEFIPYLKVVYTLLDASGSTIESGAMSPMIASDGLHYGASLAMPRPGTYKLTYRIDPPSAGGLGRHVGAGGVAAWWEPFDASFEWVVEPSKAPAPAKTS